MLTNRQIQILDNVIRQYIEIAEPVGSEESTFKKFKLSPATIRNEMKELENRGYLSHPHTSAGRVPTEEGYKFFIQNLLKKYQPNSTEQRVLEGMGDNFEENMKQKAKALSALTSEAIILSFGSSSLYYTGLANLFSKPEFKELELVVSFSEILDRLDEVICKLFEDDFKGIKILIGEENPFDRKCGMIIGKYSIGEEKGLCGVLGPVRMNYEKDISLLKHMLDSLN